MKQLQQGLALVTVLIVVALVTIIATQIGTTSYMSHRTASNMIQSDQAFYYAYGVEALGAGALQISLNTEGKGGTVAHLGQTWAKQAYTFPIEEGGDAVGVVSGKIIDMEACFNLNAILVAPKANDPNDPNLQFQSTTGQDVFVRLLDEIGIAGLPDNPTAVALAASLRDWVDGDDTPFSADSAESTEYLGYEKPYRAANTYLASVSELRVIKGFSKAVIDAIRPYVCVIPVIGSANLQAPDQIVININTVPQEKAAIVAALYTNVSVGQVSEALNERPETGFEDFAKFGAALESIVSPERPQLQGPQQGQGSQQGQQQGQQQSQQQSQTGNLVNIKTLSETFQIQIDTTYGRGRAKMNSLVFGNAKSGFKVVSRYFGEPI